MKKAGKAKKKLKEKAKKKSKKKSTQGQKTGLCEFSPDDFKKGFLHPVDMARDGNFNPDTIRVLQCAMEIQKRGESSPGALGASVSLSVLGRLVAEAVACLDPTLFMEVAKIIKQQKDKGEPFQAAADPARLVLYSYLFQYDPKIGDYVVTNERVTVEKCLVHLRERGYSRCEQWVRDAIRFTGLALHHFQS